MTELKYRHETDAPRTSFWAILSLISGIANYIGLPFVGAIVAIVTGYIARSEIKISPDKIEGERLANAGLVLGWVGIGLGLLTFCLIIFVLFGVIGGGIALSGPLSDFFNNMPRY